MNAADNKHLLLVIRHSPYGSGLARASIDVALAAAAFNQRISLLFMGDGVLQLLPEQAAEAIGRKNIGRMLASLPLYDIESVYIDAAAMTRYRIDPAASPVKAVPLDGHEIHQLMAEHDHLLGF